MNQKLLAHLQQLLRKRTQLLNNILLPRLSPNNQISTYSQVTLLPFWETVPHWCQHWSCSVPPPLQSLGRVLAEEDGSAAASLWTASSVCARRRCKRECEETCMTYLNTTIERCIYLYVGYGEYPHSSTVLSFIPVVVYLPDDVDRITLFKCQLPATQSCH